MSWTGEIVGHRGAAGLAPENTLASFDAAIAAGADRIEFDVRATADGAAVVFHDARPDRFVDGPAGRRSVYRHSLAELVRIDVGRALGRPGCHVPPLDAALDALAGRVRLNPEVKGSGAEGRAAATATVAALRAHGVPPDCVVSSFHPPVLEALRGLAPDLPRALVVAPDRQGDPVPVALQLGCVAVHPRWDLVDGSLLERCRRSGLAVRAWTVNDRETMRRLMALEVDGMVTDRPDVLAEMAGRRPPEGRD